MKDKTFHRNNTVIYTPNNTIAKFYSYIYICLKPIDWKSVQAWIRIRVTGNVRQHLHLIHKNTLAFTNSIRAFKVVCHFYKLYRNNIFLKLRKIVCHYITSCYSTPFYYINFFKKVTHKQLWLWNLMYFFERTRSCIYL